MKINNIAMKRKIFYSFILSKSPTIVGFLIIGIIDKLKGFFDKYFDIGWGRF